MLTGVVAAGAYSFTRPGNAHAAASPPLIVRGMSLPSWWNGTYRSRRYGESLTAMRDLGFNAVAVIPTHVLATSSASRIIDSEQSESFDDVAQAVALARSQGMQVLLRPHLGVVDHAVSAQAIDPADKQMFFDDYRTLVARYARLAERSGVAFLGVGGELAKLTGPDLHEPWLQVIGDARQAFNGPLVYAAGAGEDQQVSFWDALDYVGIDTSATMQPGQPVTAEAIVQHWREAPATSDAAGSHGGAAYLERLRSLSQRHRKPVLFTEVGVRSITGALRTPCDCGRTYTAADFALQTAFYQAMMQLASAESDGWLAGLFLSGWRIDAAPKRHAWA